MQSEAWTDTSVCPKLFLSEHVMIQIIISHFLAVINRKFFGLLLITTESCSDKVTDFCD